MRRKNNTSGGNERIKRIKRIKEKKRKTVYHERNSDCKCGRCTRARTHIHILVYA